MSNQTSPKLKQISITTALLSLATLLYDYFIAKVFFMEGLFLLAAAFLLTANTVRQLNRNSNSKTGLALLTNGLIVITACFVFCILALLLFGYGFHGQSVQPIWYIAALLNTILFLTAMIEIIHFIKIVSNKNTTPAK